MGDVVDVLVGVKCFSRSLMIMAASVEVIGEPLQIHIVDVLGNRTVVDCNDKDFIQMDVNGETKCSNPSIKRR